MLAIQKNQKLHNDEIIPIIKNTYKRISEYCSLSATVKLINRAVGGKTIMRVHSERKLKTTLFSNKGFVKSGRIFHAAR